MGDNMREVSVKKVLTLGLLLLVACSPTTAEPKPTGAPPQTLEMLNPAVMTRYQGINAMNFKTTICMSGYTGTIRPPVSYTGPLELHQIQTYGYNDTDPGNYEEDHVISLELGGNPRNPANLYPEPHSFSKPDDVLENELHRKVCSGSMTLSDAQNEILQVKIKHGYNREKSVA